MKYKYPQGLLGYYRQSGNTMSYNPYFKGAKALGLFKLYDILYVSLVRVGIIPRSIDWDTIEIDTNSPGHRYDYDYDCDWYFSAGQWNDGTALSDTELDRLSDTEQDRLQSIIEGQRY